MNTYVCSFPFVSAGRRPICPGAVLPCACSTAARVGRAARGGCAWTETSPPGAPSPSSARSSPPPRRRRAKPWKRRSDGSLGTSSGTEAGSTGAGGVASGRCWVEGAARTNLSTLPHSRRDRAPVISESRLDRTRARQHTPRTPHTRAMPKTANRSDVRPRISPPCSRRFARVCRSTVEASVFMGASIKRL